MLALVPLLALIPALSILPHVFSQSSNATALPLGSCTSDIPCANGACCNGKTGFCGFGPSFCGSGNCTSNCGALAECGPYAATDNVTCPLNVCCSQYGFCGTTTDFCGKGCQSNCGQPKVPSCGADQQSATQRRIGYYEGWAASRSCKSYTPEQIAAETLTHINFAFALISSSYEIIEMTPGDSDLWLRTTALKQKNPSLKVFLSIGGWTFNDPPTQHIFSNLVGSLDNINTFIASTMATLEAYSFDGIDVDWEYAAAYDRGGVRSDKENYVTFMSAVKYAFNEKGYGLTFIAPSSYWYLQHFDLPSLLDAADWVNLMSYDLHGTWDGTDPYIGYVVLAHNNLTEIDAALDLFWRAGVDASQVVIGVGFYGRSFTLADPECATAGCAWISGGDAGPCSNNAGTLMYSEIADIIESEGLEPQLDEVAGVESITWNGNQWVSFDDAASFAIKMNYANDHCISGVMIWSIDQDTSDYFELDSLFPNIASAAGGETQKGGSCITTDCGTSSCPSGFTVVGNTHDEPKHAGSKCNQRICCPTGDLPKSCTWRGGNNPPCKPDCQDGETIVSSRTCELGGTEAFCCTSGMDPDNHCEFLGCTEPPFAGSCPSSFDLLTTVVNGALTKTQTQTCQNISGKKACPTTCPSGQSKPYCCSTAKPPPVKNCHWVGAPPLCQDNGCAAGEVQLLTDPQGDGKQPCSGHNTRAYCCTPVGDAYQAVPFDDIFDPSQVVQGAETFDVEFDPDQGPNTGAQDAGTTTNGMKTDEKENDEAFGEVFIDSPNVGSVSSMDYKSDWVITSCSASSDQPQSVLAYCSKSMDHPTAGCGHVFLDGAEHTIIKMPKSCGKGPYARIASLAAHPNQNVLSAVHQSVKPASEQVYQLRFDYQFDAIPLSNGPVYMRADVTDQPGYWDEVVDSPPERREWLQSRGLWKEPNNKRWWGAFTNWLSKMNTVTKDTSVSRNFHWSDQYNIFHAQQSCPGPPAFEAQMDISLTGSASFNSRYGFYLQATVVPPAVQAAYLYFGSDAQATAEFIVTASASVTYDSSVVQFASFGFPGLYYPGLLTVGPSLVLNGYVTGALSLSGKYVHTVSYKFPSLNYALGKTSSDNIGPGVAPDSPTGGVDLSSGYSVELSGDLSVHIVPEVQMGISVLGGRVIDAQAFIRADLFAGVAINGSVSSAQALEVCFNIYYGAKVDAGVTGSVVYFESTAATWNFYDSGHIPFVAECFSSVTEPHVTSRSDYPIAFAHQIGELPRFHEHGVGAFLIDEHRNTTTVMKRQDGGGASVPQPPGSLFCPATNDEIDTTGNDEDPYSDLSQNTLEDAMYRRDFSFIADDIEDDFDDETLSANHSESLFHPVIDVKVPGCPGININPLAYQNGAASPNYFQLAFPTANNFDPTLQWYNPSPGGSYGREHIYEVQLLGRFISSLSTNTQLAPLWAGTTFCTWVSTTLLPAIKSPLQQCLPTDAMAMQRYMPWLDSVVNGMKASAIAGNQPRTQATFNGYGPRKKLSVMRSVAGVYSYLNNPLVGQSFVAQSNCMRAIWVNWGNTNAAGVNIGNIYSTWVRNVMLGVVPILQTAIQNEITWWQTTQPALATVGVPVRVDFPFRLNGATNVVVTSNALALLGAPYMNAQFAWIGQL